MGQKFTVQREDYSFGLKALNYGAGALHRLGFQFGELGEASLLESARKATGLDDWGGEHFLEPMRIMLDDVEASGMTHLARISTRDRKPLFWKRIFGLQRQACSLSQNKLQKHWVLNVQLSMKYV